MKPRIFILLINFILIFISYTKAADIVCVRRGEVICIIKNFHGNEQEINEIIESINKSPKLPKKATTLRFTKSHFHDFPTQIAKYFPKISKLVINNVGLTSLTLENIQEFKNLQHIDANSNKLTKIPPNLFDATPNIRELSLNENNIKKMDVGSLVSLTSLKILDLTSNDCINKAFLLINRRDVADLSKDILDNCQNKVIPLNMNKRRCILTGYMYMRWLRKQKKRRKKERRLERERRRREEEERRRREEEQKRQREAAAQRQRQQQEEQKRQREAAAQLQRQEQEDKKRKENEQKQKEKLKVQEKKKEKLALSIQVNINLMIKTLQTKLEEQNNKILQKEKMLLIEYIKQLHKQILELKKTQKVSTKEIESQILVYKTELEKKLQQKFEAILKQQLEKAMKSYGKIEIPWQKVELPEVPFPQMIIEGDSMKIIGSEGVMSNSGGQLEISIGSEANFGVKLENFVDNCLKGSSHMKIVEKGTGSESGWTDTTKWKENEDLKIKNPKLPNFELPVVPNVEFPTVDLPEFPKFPEVKLPSLPTIEFPHLKLPKLDIFKLPSVQNIKNSQVEMTISGSGTQKIKAHGTIAEINENIQRLEVDASKGFKGLEQVAGSATEVEDMLKTEREAESSSMHIQQINLVIEHEINLLKEKLNKLELSLDAKQQCQQKLNKLVQMMKQHSAQLEIIRSKMLKLYAQLLIKHKCQLESKHETSKSALMTKLSAIKTKLEQQMTQKFEVIIRKQIQRVLKTFGGVFMKLKWETTENTETSVSIEGSAHFTLSDEDENYGSRRRSKRSILDYSEDDEYPLQVDEVPQDNEDLNMGIESGSEWNDNLKWPTESEDLQSSTNLDTENTVKAEQIHLSTRQIKKIKKILGNLRMTTIARLIKYKKGLKSRGTLTNAKIIDLLQKEKMKMEVTMRKRLNCLLRLKFSKTSLVKFMKLIKSFVIPDISVLMASNYDRMLIESKVGSESAQFEKLIECLTQGTKLGSVLHMKMKQTHGNVESVMEIVEGIGKNSQNSVKNFKVYQNIVQKLQNSESLQMSGKVVMKINSHGDIVTQSGEQSGLIVDIFESTGTTHENHKKWLKKLLEYELKCLRNELLKIKLNKQQIEKLLQQLTVKLQHKFKTFVEIRLKLSQHYTKLLQKYKAMCAASLNEELMKIQLYNMKLYLQLTMKCHFQRLLKQEIQIVWSQIIKVSHSEQLQSIEFPEVSFPKLEFPTLEGIKFPKLEIPAIPDIQSMEFPDIEGLKIDEMNFPDIKFPEIQMVQFPDIQQIKFPSIEVTVGEQIKLPPIEKPEIPKFELPELEKIELPKIEPIEMPTIEQIELPVIEKPEMPQMEKIELPKIEKPVFPTFEVPEIPKFEFPQLPSTEIPAIPKIEIPQFPSLEFPEFPTVDASSELEKIDVTKIKCKKCADLSNFKFSPSILQKLEIFKLPSIQTIKNGQVEMTISGSGTQKIKAHGTIAEISKNIQRLEVVASKGFKGLEQVAGGTTEVEDMLKSEEPAESSSMHIQQINLVIESEINLLKDKLNKLELSLNAKKQCLHKLHKLALMMKQHSAQFEVIRCKMLKLYAQLLIKYKSQMESKHDASKQQLLVIQKKLELQMTQKFEVIIRKQIQRILKTFGGVFVKLKWEATGNTETSVNVEGSAESKVKKWDNAEDLYGKAKGSSEKSLESSHGFSASFGGSFGLSGAAKKAKNIFDIHRLF